MAVDSGVECLHSWVEGQDEPLVPLDSTILCYVCQLEQSKDKQGFDEEDVGSSSDAVWIGLYCSAQSAGTGPMRYRTSPGLAIHFCTDPHPHPNLGPFPPPTLSGFWGRLPHEFPQHKNGPVLHLPMTSLHLLYTASTH